MYIKRHTYNSDGKSYSYLKLSKSVRVGARVKRVDVVNFGRLDDPTSPAYFLDKYLTKSVEINGQQKFYTLPMAVYTVCREYLGLDNILNNIVDNSRIDIDLWIYTILMIIGRIMDPDSKLSLTRKYQDYYLPQSTPASIDVQNFYRTLSYLTEHKVSIERNIALNLTKQGLNDTTIVFYDLTSTYFEGDCCQSAKKGHSRDHRSDRVQIELGLVINNQGIPIYHEVYEGNVTDVKTYQCTVKRIADAYPDARIIFVSDKGMLSKDNIEFLDKHEYPYIVSASAFRYYSKISDLLKDKDKFKKYKDNLFYLKSSEGIICYNPETAKKSKITRDNAIKRAQDLIVKAKKNHPQDYKVFLAKHICKYHRKYFDDEYILKQVVIDKEALIDGVWLIKSNRTFKYTKTIISVYKKQADIEHAFDIIKNVLEIRPIYHHNDDRVNGHVFICVLAYAVARILEIKSQDTIHNIIERYRNSIILSINNKPHIVGEQTLLNQLKQT